MFRILKAFGRSAGLRSTGKSPVDRGLFRRFARATLVLGTLYFVVAFLAERSSVLTEVTASPAPPVFTTDANPAVATAALGPTVSGALHVHTERSHDAIGTTSEVALAASTEGLDFVLVSDHQDDRLAGLTRPRWQDEVLLIPGQERGLDQNNGRLIVLGVDSLVSFGPGTEEVENLVRDPGATVVIAHPRGPGRGNTWRPAETGGAHAWEFFNLEDGLRPALATWATPARVVGLLARAPFGRGSTSLVRAYHDATREAAAAAFDSAYAKNPLTAVGAINAHPKVRIAGQLFPSYEVSMGTVVNHVQLSEELPPDPTAAAEAVMGAIRDGGVHMSLGDASEARAFQVAVTRDGRRMGGMGDAVPLSSGMELSAHFGPEEPRVLYRVVKDGVALGWHPGPSLRTALSDPGAYRVEVYRYSARLGSFYWNLRPWIFGNPVRVVATPGP